MNKAQLITKIAEKNGISGAAAARMLDSFIEVVQTTVASGEAVELVGFGKFATGERAARAGRNPQTGAPIEIAACKAVTFKAGKAFKDAVNA